MKNIDVLVSSVLCCHFVASDGRAFEPREIFFGESRRTFQTKLNGSFKQLNIKKSNLLFGTLASPFFLKKNICSDKAWLFVWLFPVQFLDCAVGRRAACSSMSQLCRTFQRFFGSKKTPLSVSIAKSYFQRATAQHLIRT